MANKSLEWKCIKCIYLQTMHMRVKMQKNPLFVAIYTNINTSLFVFNVQVFEGRNKGGRGVFTLSVALKVEW